MIAPQAVAITSTDSSPSFVKLPFNAKLLMEDEVECDFKEEIFVAVDVEFIIKNLFSSKEINLAVEFT